MDILLNLRCIDCRKVFTVDEENVEDDQVFARIARTKCMFLTWTKSSRPVPLARANHYIQTASLDCQRAYPMAGCAFGWRGSMGGFQL